MMKKILVPFFFLCFCVLHSQLFSADAVWVGTNGDLSVSTNWASSTSPTLSTNADFNAAALNFAPFLNTTPVVNTQGLVFSGSTNYAFTIGNNGVLHVGSGGIAPSVLPMSVTFTMTPINGLLTFSNCSLATAVINHNSNGGQLVLIGVSGDNATVNMSNTAELQIGPGGNATIGQLTSASASDAISLSSTLTVGNLNLPSTIAAKIQNGFGAGQLIKVGGGTLALTNTSNSYSGGTSINGGTLQISQTGNLPPTGTLTFNATGVVLDTLAGGVTIPNLILLSRHGTINVDSGTTIASGQISGIGALTKTGNGILALSSLSQNNYGDTIINQGTIQISQPSNLSNIGVVNFLSGSTGVLETTASINIPNPIFIVTNGTIKVDNSSYTTTLSDQIAGTGSLTKTEAGILALGFGSNIYGGGTNINEGTLQISQAGNLPGSGTITFSVSGSPTLDTQNGGFTIPNPILLSGSGNGTVKVNANTTTLSGPISGGGGLTASGSGTLLLSGVNNYSGGTTVVSPCGLQGNTSSLQGDITNNGGVVFNQDFSGAYGGNISGTGVLDKYGSGTVTLSGTNTYSGFTYLGRGRLNVNGSVSHPSSFFTVAPKATLGGAGTITSSDILIGGTLQPGNSIGTIILVGPVTFSTGSTYLVEFDSLHCDRANVTGSVTISSGSSVALQEDQIILHPTSYPIITATTGVSGTFTTLNNPYPFLNASLSYASGSVLLNLNRKSFETVLSSSNAPFNAVAVGSALDQVNPLGGSDLDQIVANLMLATSIDELIQDLLQMQPSRLKALGVSETNTTVQLHSLIAEHADSYMKSACTLKERKKWSVWTDLFGIFSHQTRLRGELGFHDKTGGCLIGIDSSPLKNLSVGGAAAYTFTHLEWNHNPSNATVQNGYGILYANWYSRHFFATSALTVGYNHNNAHRSIQLMTSAIDTTARSSFSGVEGSGFVEMGGIVHYHKMQFMPFASLHYCYLHQNHFRERGADGLDLRVDGANTDLLRSEAGLQISSCYRRDDYEWIPRLSASAIEENRFKGKYYRAEFVENPGVFFTVKGLHPNHTLFSPKASIQLKKGENFSTFLGYEGEFGSKFHNNRAHLFMNYSF